MKKLIKHNAARWDEFKGNDFYEGGVEVPAQNIILDGGKNITARYLVAIDDDGTKSDSVRLKMEIPTGVTPSAARPWSSKQRSTRRRSPDGSCSGATTSWRISAATASSWS